MKPNSFKTYKLELRRAAKLPHSYKKNATDFSRFLLRHSYGVSPKILVDEAVRNGIDAVYKKFGSSAKTKGVVTVYPVGNGAIAFTDNGNGITPKTASENLLRLSNSGSSRADEIISGTAQHFGIGVKQLANKFDLTYFSRAEDSPLIAFTVIADSNGLIDFDEGAIRLPSLAQLPSDMSFAAGEKSRGTTTGAGRAKSVQDFFNQNETGTYLIIQPKEQGLKGYQSLLGRGKSSTNRDVVKWIESRYDYAPCLIKVARCDSRGDVGSFLTVTGLFDKFSSKSTPFSFSATSSIYGNMLVYAFAGKINSGDNGQLPCHSLGALKYKERLLVANLSHSGHKNLLAQLGLRRLANEGLRLIVEFADESRFDMTTDRQALVDLESNEQVQISNVFEAIAAEVELPSELIEMEEALSAEGSKDIKGCEDWLRQYSMGNAINTRREGGASGGNPSTDRDDARSSRKKAVQSWCHWPRRTNAAPSTNEAQDGGEKGQAISGHAVVEVDFNLALDTDTPFSWTTPCAAYPAGVVSVCLDHSFNKIGLSLVRKALEGSKGEKVSEETVRTAYQTIKMGTIQSQLTFLVNQGLVSSLTEIKEEQVKMSLAWTYAESQLASHRRSQLIN